MAEQKHAVEQPTAGWQTSGAGHPRRWAILAVLVTSLLVVVLDNTILNIALPTIQRDLGADQSQLLWAVDAYILVFAALLFTWGVLGDKYGRKRILIIGLTVFAIASAACAFATTPTMLIVFRGLMGIGGAAVLPVTLAVITVVFPPHERGRAIGAWAGAVGGAVALGPVLGGLLLENPQWTSWLTGNDWGGVFLINVPIVIIGLVGIFLVVPETRNPHPQALDIPGLLISFTGLVLFVYGIIHASQTLTFLTPAVLVPMILGALVLTGFVITEARSDHRSFDVTLFKNRGYAVSLSAVTLAFFAMNGITFTLPFFLQTLRGYSTLQAGLCFLPFAIGQIIAAPRSAGMVNRFGYKRVMTAGLSFVGASLLILSFSLHLDTPLWVILAVFFVFGFGMGNVMAPASTVMQNALPLARAGAGSAVQNTVRQVGGALGVAVIGTVLATQYAKSLQPALDSLPAQFPSAAKDAMSNSVISTVTVLQEAAAQGLPATVVAATRATAFDAFLSASHVTTLISTGIVVVAALVVWFLLPPITPPQKGAHAPGGRPANHGDDLELQHVGEARTRDEADAEATELEESYAAELAEEFGVAVAEPRPVVASDAPAEVDRA
ncbi:MAG: DHA2 family efflux MFS transporter permease subunit [Actinomycetales bacterium]|nr:DHA2 family efflux MFS transporter permease subunit [Actinomycetales bacterium]